MHAPGVEVRGSFGSRDQRGERRTAETSRMNEPKIGLAGVEGCSPAACRRKYLLMVLGLAILGASLACTNRTESVRDDHPHLTPNVFVQDVTFHSRALDREIPYRVILPRNIPPGSKLPVVYLLHGGNGSFRDWSNNTDVARFAERGLILVMPDGDESWYTNSAERPGDRYEDYITQDLV